MKVHLYFEEREDGRCTPMNFANAMVNQGIFKTDELEELAEYLLVFCRHNVTNNGEVYRED